MDIGSVWAPVVAGLGALILAIAGPFVTGHFEHQARKGERREIDQREVLRALPNEMYEYLVAATFAVGGTTEKPGPDFLTENLDTHV